MENRLLHAGALGLANRLNRYLGRNESELKKMVLGMEILLVNVSKMIVIYLLAILVGAVVQTAILQAGYVLIKRFSFGLHALNSTVCAAVSCFMFVVAPWLLMGVGVGNVVVFTVFIPVLFCLLKFAPADTKARPLIGSILRARLKKKAVGCGVALMAITLLIPSYEIKFLLTLGAVYQCIAILPLTYRLLKRSERNYEKYERL